MCGIATAVGIDGYFERVNASDDVREGKAVDQDSDDAGMAHGKRLHVGSDLQQYRIDLCVCPRGDGGGLNRKGISCTKWRQVS